MKHDYTDDEIRSACKDVMSLRAFLEALPARPQTDEIAALKAALAESEKQFQNKVYEIACLLDECDKAQGILKACLSVMPFGNIKTHTFENLPGRIADLASEIASLSLENERLEAELAAAHSVLDGDPSEIIRNAAQGYPEGRAPRELTLAERVQALCKYAADYAEWHKKAQAELAALRQPILADDGRSLGQVAFYAGNAVQKIKFPKREIETWEESAEVHDMLEAAAQAVADVVEARMIRRMEAVPLEELEKAYWDGNEAVACHTALKRVRARLLAAAKGEGQPVGVNEPPQSEGQPDLSGESEKQTEPAWIPHDGGPCPLKDEEVEEWGEKRSIGGEYVWKFPPSQAAGWSPKIRNSITHYRVLRWKSGFGPEAKAEPSTFEAHGKTWTRHTPGDPMPCDGEAQIYILCHDNIERSCCVTASNARWDKINSADIIGWRYADEPAQPTTSPGWTPTVGQTVRLKSGGPVMTVYRIAKDSSFGCLHNVNGPFQCMTLPSACLTPVPNP